MTADERATFRAILERADLIRPQERLSDQEITDLLSSLYLDKEALHQAEGVDDTEMAMGMAQAHVAEHAYTIHSSQREIKVVNGRDVVSYFPIRRQATAEDVLAARLDDRGLHFTLSNGTKHRIEV